MTQDPWAPKEDLWEPPPPRYPKGQPAGSLKRPRNPARARRTPRPTPVDPLETPNTTMTDLAPGVGDRGPSPGGGKGNEAESGGEEGEESMMDRLVGFTRDREARPSHDGALLPGEDGVGLLRDLRACQAAAWGEGTPLCIARLCHLQEGDL